MKKVLFLSLLFVCIGLNNITYAQIFSVYETPKGDTYYSLDELIASGADTARAVRATDRDYRDCSWQTEWLPVWSNGLVEEFLWFASFDMEKNNSRSLSDSVWIENITFLPNAGIKVKIGYTSATTENWFRFNFGTLSFGVNQYNSISYYTDVPGVNYVEIEHHDNLVVGQTYYIKAFQHWPQVISGRVLTFTMQLPSDPCVNFDPNISCGDTTLCKGESATLTSSNGASYQWSNGANTKSINVNISGIYTVTVTDVNGCTGTDKVNVLFNEKPDVFLLTAQQTGLMGMSDMISVMGSNLSSYLFHWDKSVSPNPTILVSEEGIYTVTVTDENTWCTTVLSTEVGFMECPVVIDTSGNGGGTGGPKPVANFTVSNNQGCGPLTVQYSDLSTNNPTSWQWSFPGGNPATSTAQNPVVVYNPFGEGSYSASLIATNANGSSNTFSLTNVVRVTGQAPNILSVTASPPQIWPGEISELSVFVAGTSSYSYSWSNAGSLNNPNYQNPVAAPMVTTPYIVQVIDNNTSCASLGYVTVTVFGTVANNEVDENQFDIVSDVSYEDILIKSSVQHYQALLVDVRGVVLKHQNCNEYETLFSKKGLVSGDYFLTILVGNNVYTETVTVVN